MSTVLNQIKLMIIIYVLHCTIKSWERGPGDDRGYCTPIFNFKVPTLCACLLLILIDSFNPSHLENALDMVSPNHHGWRQY